METLALDEVTNYEDKLSHSLGKLIEWKHGKVGSPCINPKRLSHSLEKKGLIESRWGDEGREETGARLRYYKLTGSGVATLEAIQSFRSNLLSWQPT